MCAAELCAVASTSYSSCLFIYLFITQKNLYTQRAKKDVVAGKNFTGTGNTVLFTGYG